MSLELNNNLGIEKLAGLVKLVSTLLKTPATKAVVNTAYFPNIMDLAFYSHEQDNNVINNNVARLLVPGAGLINGLSSDNGTRMVTAVSAGLGGAMSGHLKNPHIALATAGGVDLAANGIQGIYKMIDQQENLTDALKQLSSSFNDVAKMERNKLDLEKQKIDLENQALKVLLNTNQANLESAESQQRAALLSLYGDIAKTTLGVAAGGIGLYALYKWLTKKPEPLAARMKLRLKGKEGDPYTDSIVDIPLEQVDVSRAIGNDLQGGIRRAVQRNAKYTTRKKDPESGKLISYSDYVSKYGDPEESGGDDNFGNTSW